MTPLNTIIEEEKEDDWNEDVERNEELMKPSEIFDGVYSKFVWQKTFVKFPNLPEEQCYSCKSDGKVESQQI